MTVELHRARALQGPFGFAVITVSDSRTLKTDRGGPKLRELVEGAGHAVAFATIVVDEEGAIREAVEGCLECAGVDAVLLTGGTGLSPRDVTPEAVVPLFEREIPGFGELFRQLSWAEIGAAAMLSRAAAGLARGRAIFLLPGSPGALALAMERLVLPELGHLLAQARRERDAV